MTDWEDIVHAMGTDADPRTVFCGSCGSSDISVFEDDDRVGRTNTGRVVLKCNDCEREWDE
jgi:hypothetical protein